MKNTKINKIKNIGFIAVVAICFMALFLATIFLSN